MNGMFVTYNAIMYDTSLKHIVDTPLANTHSLNFEGSVLVNVQ